jgi:uncharacterized membrane protein YdjX (TVP38/TMEM64 family)
MKKSRAFLLIAIVISIGLFFAFDLQANFTLETLKSKQAAMLAFYQAHPMVTLAIYMLIYVATTALSLPGATILTLAGGGIFGLGMGTLVVSFASTIGASLAFLAARFLFRDAVKAKFGDRLATIDEGMAKEGAFYLFTLRLVPAVPFFMINLLMGLTVIKLRTFYWVSQLGMLAGTIVYVNAGTQLAKLDSLSGIVSPLLVGSFVMLGLFPLLAKKVIDLARMDTTDV